MNNSLIKPFTSDEVYNALKTINPDKSPGCDGMSAMFYHNYWSIVGDVVTKVVLEILNEGCSMESINKSLITLIPKIKSPTGMGDFRPISLCNVIYKIISKALALRFKDVLPAVILETQSAFLSNRIITDNILVAFELIHHLKHKTRGNRGYSALKLDMSKAFDRVEWFYIQEVMLKMGFHSTWVSLIMGCLSSTSFSFMLNGEEVGHVKPTRGLRQGDPLSPEEEVHNLRGLKLTRHAPSISHLLFADDSLLFCEATNSSSIAINKVLDIYHEASGQLLNTAKSVMSFSPNTSQSAQNFFHQTLGMPISDCHERYLGLPAFSERDKKEMFSDVKERIWQKLHAWNEKLFSVGGKEVLLKAVVQSIPTYAMSCFRLPTTFCTQLESMMANFWWGSNKDGSKIHWKSWKLFCKSKFEGGMEFRSFTSGFPGNNVFTPVSYTGPPNLPVSYFITEQRVWNLPLLHDHFQPIDVDRIVSIPLCYFPSNDRYIWHHTMTGMYTVNSGFHLAENLAKGNESSGSSAHSEWKVVNSATCSLCNNAWESIGHAMFNCTTARKVWRETKFTIDHSNAHNMDNGDYLIHLSTLYSKQDFELLVCTMWAIWHNRNKVTHGGVSRPSHAIASFAVTHLERFISSKAKHYHGSASIIPPVTVSTSIHTPEVAPVARLHQDNTRHSPWLPPSPTGLKLNVDAAVNHELKILGIGVVIRDYLGNVVAALSKPVQGCFRSDEMEAKALFHSLNWVVQMPLSISHIETDALRVSLALNSTSCNLSSFNDLIVDISCLLSFFSGVTISHVKRNANQTAHGLAKYALELDEDIC
ncbi:uncharacterized protein LOC133030622 [Cannabis sativa]|uniref:uncharacterized protein LOC133030622 n=1 Tax=Cannabis sativa TaxID=3483 RepID=UPI0029CA5C81|nr:uncharacterized protein LOC133030622 [Cannabis sativa]